MALSNKGCFVYPSGIAVPSIRVPKGETVSLPKDIQFEALLSLYIENREDEGIAALELKTAELAFRQLDGHCLPVEFFDYNINYNDNVSPAGVKFLQETVNYIEGKGRTISARLFCELMQMPSVETALAAKHPQYRGSVASVMYNNKDMISLWLSNNDGLLDMLYTYRGMFG